MYGSSSRRRIRARVSRARVTRTHRGHNPMIGHGPARLEFPAPPPQPSPRAVDHRGDVPRCDHCAGRAAGDRVLATGRHDRDGDARPRPPSRRPLSPARAPRRSPTNSRGRWRPAASSRSPEPAAGRARSCRSPRPRSGRPSSRPAPTTPPGSPSTAAPSRAPRRASRGVPTSRRGWRNRPASRSATRDRASATSETSGTGPSRPAGRSPTARASSRIQATSSCSATITSGSSRRCSRTAASRRSRATTPDQVSRVVRGAGEATGYVRAAR